MSTYPRADEYWVAPHEQDQYPARHGDIFAAPDLTACQAGGVPFYAVAVLHPSCELGAKARPDGLITVARVRPITDVPEAQRPALRGGWVERDGIIQRAHVHTFWLPPLPGDDELDLYIDFREVAAVRFRDLTQRRAAMTHDTRVHLIAREIYFRYRWAVTVEDVRDSEARRISGDRDFRGPRPQWAPLSERT